MRTYSAKPGEVTRNWWVVDAEGKNLGRLSTEIADVLRGKNKPQYTPHVDTGDFVVVVNAEKVAVTGNKLTGKLYHRHSGYPGGLQDSHSRADARAAAYRSNQQGGQGYAAQEPSRRPATDQTQDLRRAQASACRPEAGGVAMAAVVYSATGKRKTSVARVRLMPGTGNITVNGKDVKDYFNRQTLVLAVQGRRWSRRAPTPATTSSPTPVVAASRVRPGP